MSSFHNADFFRVQDFGTAIVIILGNFGEGAKKVDLGQVMGRFQDATALFGEMPSYFTEQLVLKVQTPVFGAKYLGFKFFELWRDEAFGIDQGLFAYEIVRHLVAERFADLEKIAKDFVVTNFKFWEAGGLSFLLFKVEYQLPAISQYTYQVVELRIIAFPNEIATRAGQEGLPG